MVGVSVQFAAKDEPYVGKSHAEVYSLKSGRSNTQTWTKAKKVTPAKEAIHSLPEV